MDDNQKDELNQVAKLVIDAYLRRDEVFIPAFEGGTGVMYLSHGEGNGPQGDGNPKRPVLNFWYESSDYEDGGDEKS